METDRIEKQILLRAPLARIWRALTDSTEFGTWFGMRFPEPFVPGAVLHGKIVPTTVDPEVGAAQKQYEGLACEIVIERMDPEKLFSFRWHPGAVDPRVDYSQEPMTLVEFRLEQKADGVLLTIAESGFDRIPLARRAQTFAGNEAGWGKVTGLIAEYLKRAQ